MTKELTLKEIIEIRDFIQCNIGGEIGVIKGKIIPSTPIPSADGYALIAWSNEVHNSNDSRNPIVKFSSFYPAEELEPRYLARKKQSHILPVYRDNGLTCEKGIFRFTGKRCGGQSWYYPDSFDYLSFSQRLEQEELALVP
jgi:hypothetical protein